MSEKDASNIMRQLFSAVGYLHNHNIAHRDIKPENSLFDNKNDLDIKISDLGTAINMNPNDICKNERLTELVGTPYYIAPEVLLGNYDQ